MGQQSQTNRTEANAAAGSERIGEWRHLSNLTMLS
jgi:hypothetical protein